MPRPIPPLDEGVYKELVGYLHPPPPPARPLEIDVLHPTLATSIQYSAEDSALGIPKNVLINCFLVAHCHFFNLKPAENIITHESPYEEKCRGGQGNNGADEEARVNVDEAEREEDARRMYEASTVLLLWDPNHNTAINYRKRYISLPVTSSSNHHDPDEPAKSRTEASTHQLVRSELHFLRSLLTSPMKKHNKSSTLFTHRLWLLCTFILPQSAVSHSSNQRGMKGMDKEDKAGLWSTELDLVMVAGDKHPANYYAWNYARDVLELLDERGVVAGKDRADWQGVLIESMEMVKAWCFRHPRDVSGWTFLKVLVEMVASCGEDEAGLDHASRAYEEVNQWKAKLQWEGAAIDAFTIEAVPFEARANDLMR